MTATAQPPQPAALKMLLDNSKPVQMNPVLFRMNGVGFMFAGVGLRHPDIGKEYFVRMHWFTIFFVPVFPCGIYLLSLPVNQKGRPQSGSYYIHRAVKVKAVNNIWGFWKLLWLFVSGWVIVIAIIVGFFAIMETLAMNSGGR